MNKNIKTKINLKLVIFLLLFLVVLFFITKSSVFFMQTNRIVDSKIAQEKENRRPANISIIVITDSVCSDCFDLNPFIENIKKSNINIKNEKLLQREDVQAKELIEKFSIKKLPTFIISGEINKEISLSKLWEKAGEIQDGFFVFRKTGVPYIEADSGKIRGKVNLAIISDNNCENCFNASLYENLPKKLGMSVSQIDRIEYKTIQGRNLVKKYKIKAIPTIIIEGDLEPYSIQTLEKLGDINGDVFVLTEVNPPYISTMSGLLKGVLNLTIITSNNCDKCYDVNVYDNIIKQFGLYIKSEKKVDISSYNGKYLINKYKISAVPTIIITGDMDLYNKSGSVWSNIGTIEKDGAYVLREGGVKQLGVYKNLTTE